MSEGKTPAANYPTILAFIAQCVDARQLRTVMENARKRGQTPVADAAFRRLTSILPSESPGTLEYDFWKTIYAFEEALTEERGKTTRLSRTRQKVARVGELETLKDWALNTKETDGFRMLLDRGMPELTGEAIVLRHPERFAEDVATAARQKLEVAGVDVGSLPHQA
jgi:hypothetical protein